MRMTDRLKRIIRLAEGERLGTGCRFIQPEHLLAGCLLERTGAFAELANKCRLDISTLRSAAIKNSEEGGSLPAGFPAEISEETKVVMEAAAGYMKRYGQMILNEGHLLKALLSCDSLADWQGRKINSRC
ncbi:Clp protease N-terminal domain-containing protein [Bacillus infantis]|uniref:Clp protease N-terminal domain-containing protein n=1 Tax=Bacillus infantis TaxID=324767 RepID=UPI003CEED5FF